MLQKGNKGVFFIAFLIFGLLVAVQFRSTMEKNRLRAANAIDVERLTASVDYEKTLERTLREEIETINSGIESYIRMNLEPKKDDGLREYEWLKFKAGLTDVKGPGISIELNDAAARDEGNWRDLIIHDSDLKIILNELKNAGAQAVSVNGERIVPMSELFCAGPTVIINNNTHPVPYVINAIGNPDTLYDSISQCERVQVMLEDKIRIEIKKSNELEIPRFSSSENIKKYISKLEVVKK